MKILLALVLAGAPLLARADDAAALFAAKLIDLDGKPYAGEVLRGKPLVVNFWARRCDPCRQEIPDLVAADARYRTQGVTTVGIGIEERAESVREFAKAHDMNYLVLLAGDQGLKLLRSVGNTSAGLPYTMAINRAGKIVSRKLGVMDRAEMDAAFQRALRP